MRIHVFGDGAKMMGPKRGQLGSNEFIRIEAGLTGLCFYTKKKNHRAYFFLRKTVQSHDEKVAICRPRRESSPEAKLTKTLILHPWPP